ncbi:MerR family transcriptional regulator [Streptomyces sp. NPDC006691]|uniref:MerR family transcriptional regulator n=1 Tax=Streptomyces sp. NPDC006691 TaxID=3364757 RepID=UPI0036AA295C
MRIGELAARAGTTTRALRYYESRGLLAARRTGNGYRTYDEDDLRLLQQIRTLQDFGFDLEETRPFVECLRAGHPAGDSCPASLAVYRRKLAELDALIDELGAVRTRVRAELARAEVLATAEAPGGPEPRCELSPGGMTGAADARGDRTTADLRG